MMTQEQMRGELSSLIYESGMSTPNFSQAMGITRKRLIRVLQEKEDVSPNFLAVARGVIEQLNLVQSIVDHNPKLRRISYVVWKKILNENILDEEEMY